MKKVAKWLALAAVTVCVCVMFAACGGDSDVKGTYEGSVEQTIEGLGEIKASVTLELKADDKFTMTVKSQMGENKNEASMDGTYKVDGEKLSLTVVEDGEEDTQEATIKDGKITIDVDGQKFELKKK